MLDCIQYDANMVQHMDNMTKTLVYQAAQMLWCSKDDRDAMRQAGWPTLPASDACQLAETIFKVIVTKKRSCPADNRASPYFQKRIVAQLVRLSNAFDFYHDLHMDEFIWLQRAVHILDKHDNTDSMTQTLVCRAAGMLTCSLADRRAMHQAGWPSLPANYANSQIAETIFKVLARNRWGASTDMQRRIVKQLVGLYLPAKLAK